MVKRVQTFAHFETTVSLAEDLAVSVSENPTPGLALLCHLELECDVLHDAGGRCRKNHDVHVHRWVKATEGCFLVALEA